MEPHWQRSRHDYPTIPPPAEAAVAILGGGIVGCSLALRLAEAGMRPLLIERGRVADGASGRNGGLLLPGTAELFGALERRWGSERARRLWALSCQGAERLVERIEALEADGLDCAWRGEGALHVAEDEAEAGELREDAERLVAAGFEGEWLDRGQLSDFSDLPLPADFLGALHLPGGGCLHSGMLVTALAAAAEKAGARIVEGVDVQAIEAGTPSRLRTSAGPLLAHRLLVAGNAWAGPLLPRWSGAITPVRGQVLATVPLPPRRIRGAWSMHQGYEYLQQLPDGRVVLGGLRWMAPDREVGRVDALPELTIQAGLADWLRRRWPDLLAGAADPEHFVERRWAGIMAWTPDRLPLIGPAPGWPGLWMACGFSGHGLPFAQLAAEILAAELTGAEPPDGSRAFDPDRFDEGTPPTRA